MTHSITCFRSLHKHHIHEFFSIKWSTLHYFFLLSFLLLWFIFLHNIYHFLISNKFTFLYYYVRSMRMEDFLFYLFLFLIPESLLYSISRKVFKHSIHSVNKAWVEQVIMNTYLFNEMWSNYNKSYHWKILKYIQTITAKC